MDVWGRLTALSPLAAGLKGYRREMFFGDLSGGVLAAITLVPQAMAYAMLAGLPPQVGLYASILPLVFYGLFGSSNSLSVGPVAIISLLVLSGVGPLASPGSPDYIGLCLTLAALAGLIQVAMSVFRMGFLINFISHPVLVGFTNGAAVIICFSQLKHLLGIYVERDESPIYWMLTSLTVFREANPATVAIGAAGCLVLLFFGVGLSPVMRWLRASPAVATMATRLGPMLTVIAATTFVWLAQWDRARQVAVVGAIPGGLPPLTWPALDPDTVRQLAPVALVVALVGYIQSISVAKALASRKRERVDANRELLALGMADVAASLTGGCPVAGSFSCSVVKDAAGARTPLGSIITAGLVAMAAAFMTSWFYYVPRAALAAIIIVSVVTLIDVSAPWRLWRYSRADAIALWLTFLAALIWGIESGVVVGVATTIAIWMWKTSRPHIAEVGRIPGSEHFRNIERHQVETVDGVLAVRVDESLYFANATYLYDFLTKRLAERKEIDAVLLIASGINHIDATGLQVLRSLIDELKDADVRFVLSDVKGPVSDRMRRSGFDAEFLENSVYLSADLAAKALERYMTKRREEGLAENSDPAAPEGLERKTAVPLSDEPPTGQRHS